MREGDDPEWFKDGPLQYHEVMALRKQKQKETRRQRDAAQRAAKRGEVPVPKSSDPESEAAIAPTIEPTAETTPALRTDVPPQPTVIMDSPSADPLIRSSARSLLNAVGPSGVE